MLQKFFSNFQSYYQHQPRHLLYLRHKNNKVSSSTDNLNIQQPPIKHNHLLISILIDDKADRSKKKYIIM